MPYNPVASLAALRAIAELDGAAPTDQQRHILTGWAGWGPLAPALGSNPTGAWVQVADQLEDILTGRPDWAAAAVNATDTSFYTPAWLIEAMLDALVRAGFTGGEVLEPGCGSGRFMSGHLPGARWTGIEVDPASAAIAAALHPEATIHAAPLEKVTLREGTFDAAIGNVPFSQHAPYDPEVDAPNLHTYFLLRSLMAVRPGGYVMAITSRRLFDTDRQIDALTEVAEIRSVARLASHTFEGTGAVADLLMLRRRGGPAAPGEWDDITERATTRESASLYGSSYYASAAQRARRLIVRNEAGESGHGKPAVEVNRHFEVHPDRVAGRMVATGYDRAPLRVLSDDPRTDGMAAVAAATANLPVIPARVGPVDPFAGIVLADADGRKEGSYHLEGDQVVQITDGQPTPVARPSAELRTLVGLRDLAVALLAADADAMHHTGADVNADLRTRMRTGYQAYATRFGPLNRGTLHEGAIDTETGEPKLSWRRPSMGGFRRDPDYLTVMACESYDPDSQTAAPAPVLLRPVNRAPAPVERVETPTEALAVSLGESASVDLGRIASLLGLETRAQAAHALGDLVYVDPDTDTYLPARDYLSGDVRGKLARAQAAAATDPSLHRNVTALQQVLPADFGPLNIRATIGSPWIAPHHIETFAGEVLGARPSVTYAAALGLWEVDGGWYGSPQLGLRWGTGRKDPLQLLAAALNGRSVTVWDEVWDEGKRGWRKVRNAAETLAAEDKLTAMQDRFGTWVWEDADRAAELVAEFNTRFRSHVPRVADGSGLTFPGIAEGVELWKWQRDAVERVISSERTLIAHAVGAGKTRSMVASAVTLRRLGLANKPMIVVPGHLLEQIAREATQTFPAARFLIAGREDLAGNGRRLFAARCATGDWDAIIVTMEAFGSIPVAPQAEEEWVAEQKVALAEAIRLDGNRSSRSKTAKAIAASMKKLDARLAELRHKAGDDDTVRFEHLGVDFIAVDEVHQAKRLPITTRAEGFSMGASKRATDLLLKVSILGQRRPGKPHFAGFTGTPWTNSLAESFVWQTFFQPEALRRAGIDNFDAWAAMFVRYVTAVEVAPDGSGFRLHRRPSQITNVQALMGMLRQVTDLLPASALPLDRPEATWHTRVADMTEGQAAYVAELAVRAERIRGGGVQDDNMLLVVGDGRRAALDPRLVGVPEDSTKVGVVAEQVARIYHANTARTFGSSTTPGGFQLVLCDQGTPGDKGTQTYGRLKAALVAAGVPASMVRFAHEATTDKGRDALFAACRDGSVAILLGSTSRVGFGTNIQTRMVGLHHVDAPWRPSDIEQREGRALRPGNLSGHVDIFRYVTEGTFDAYMWQTLQTKARFIHALMHADTTVDNLDDIGETVLSYGEVKALASGNPRLLEHAEAAAQVRRLRTLLAVHNQQVNTSRKDSKQADQHADSLRRQAENIETALTAISPDQQEGRSRQSERVAEMLTRPRTDSWQRPVAWWCGLAIEAQRTEPGARFAEVAVKHQYRELGLIRITYKALRHDPVTAADNALASWLAEAPEMVGRLRERASQLIEVSAQAVAAADGAVFDQAKELTAAEARLASIEHELQAEAEESTEQSANRPRVAVAA